MNALVQDIRFGFRMIQKNIGITTMAVILLGIGIGANTAIFSIIYGVMLKPLPFPEPDRLAWVQTKWLNGGEGSSSGPDYLDWRDQNTVFENLSAIRSFNRFNLTGLGEPIAVKGSQVTSNFFSVIKLPVYYGRDFRPDEMEKGKEKVIILSHSFWKTKFNADTSVINKILNIDQAPYTIIGIAKPMMGFMEDLNQIYLPLTTDQLKQSRGNHLLDVMGRLKGNVSLQQAQEELKIISSRLEKEYTNTNKNTFATISLLQEIIISEIRPVFLILYAAVGILLMIACINVSSMVLAKASSRTKEIAIRSALGAGKWRVFRQVVTESIVLSFCGGLLGILLAMWGLDFLKMIAPQVSRTGSIAGLDEIKMNMPVLLFTFGLSLLTGFFFGLVPAWQTAKTNISDTLKESGRGTMMSVSRHRILNSLVVFQVAAALILLVGAGLLVKSFYKIQQSNPGFEADNLLAVQMDLAKTKEHEDGKNRALFYNRLIDNLHSLPGVKSVGAVCFHPMNSSRSKNSFAIEGRPPLPPGEFIAAEYRNISQDYFQTMKIPLRKGRYFTALDDGKSKPVIIVSEEFVRRFFPNEEPLGQKIILGDQHCEITGIVGDVKDRSLSNTDYRPYMYVPFTQDCWHIMTIFLRGDGDPIQYAPAVRKSVYTIDPNQPVVQISTMNQIAMNSVSLNRFCTILLCLMAGIALFMAIMGLYGIIAYSVTERTHEIGIRMALGAQVRDILFMVIQKGLLITGIGIAVGLLGSFMATKAMQFMLFEISSTDPITYIMIPFILIIVALAACLFPARRAAKTNPMNTLRCE